MTTNPEKRPVMDLHCDLLDYLSVAKGATADQSKEIGCTIPRLKEGGVKLQVMAMYVATGQGSVEKLMKQCELFTKLLSDFKDDLFHVRNAQDAREALIDSRIGVLTAIENASGLCDENESLDIAFTRLEQVIESVGPLLYLSMTHHYENRFGGGNLSAEGLKDDGRALLDFMNGRKIAIDLSHTSDALARGILDHLDENDLDIPVIASHSNYRSVCDQARNLPDDLAKEVIRRKGLIGANLVRDFVDPEDPARLNDHVKHGLELGGAASLSFGVDYFYASGCDGCAHGAYFFEEHAHAGKYPGILQSLEGVLDEQGLAAMSHENGVRFIERIWN